MRDKGVVQNRVTLWRDSHLAEEHQVSRKFIYQQGDKAAWFKTG